MHTEARDGSNDIVHSISICTMPKRSPKEGPDCNTKFEHVGFSCSTGAFPKCRPSLDFASTTDKPNSAPHPELVCCSRKRLKEVPNL